MKKTTIAFYESIMIAVFFAVIGAMSWYQPYAERAAYLEARYNYDHDIAIAQAFNEGREACKNFNP